MLFIDWRLLQILVGGALIIAGSVWIYRSMSKKRGVIRLPSRILSGIVAGICSPVYLLFCFGALLSFIEGCDTHGAPIYSPNPKMAVRIETSDGGALGGYTNVRLYTAYGFDTYTVFAGGWRSVEQKDVRWLTNAILEVRYSDDSSEHSCESTRSVEVHCIFRSPRPAYPNYDGARSTKP